MTDLAKNGLLRVERITRRFGGVIAVNDVSFSLERGEIFGLVGPNGSGKTTLVNAISGFYPPQDGAIFMNGDNITKLRPYKIAEKRVARTFQNVALFNGMTVLQNILLGRHQYSKSTVSGVVAYPFRDKYYDSKNIEYVEQIIKFMQLESYRNFLVDGLPLGIKKRIELARALSAEPKLLILDEPMAGMNEEETDYIARYILDIRNLMKISILIIEHHMNVITGICDRVMVMNNGRRIALGEPRDIFRLPAVIEAYIG